MKKTTTSLMNQSGNKLTAASLNSIKGGQADLSKPLDPKDPTPTPTCPACRSGFPGPSCPACRSGLSGGVGDYVSGYTVEL
ncbi:hypothetical protein ACTHGU_21970 [Chitinophagaceae bacterium MMS25-I14]